MTYEHNERELNFVKDSALHAIFATLSAEDRRRVCVAISGCEDESEIDAYAEGMVEQILAEKR